MILYFSDRQLNILGQASTELPHGLTVVDDWKSDEIETGVAIFECVIPFDDETRKLVEACTKPGNYILRSYDGANEFYTITEREIDTKKQEVSLYAEDAGLDLLNEIVEAYEAEEEQPISFYIEKFAYDSGFEIGVNEVSTLKRKLSWDSDSSAAERIASVATQFDGCEISYSFAIKGLEITHKYINIYKERGKDIGEHLRLNKDIDKIIRKESIIKLATALKCTGGTPDQTTDILEATSDSGTPKIKYNVSLETLSRTKNTAEFLATVSASMEGEEAKLGTGYVLTASIYMGGAWHNVTVKETDEEWSGEIGHTNDAKFTVSGLTAAAITYKDIKFKVTRSDSKGGTVGILSEKVCSQYILTNYIEGGENGEGIADRPMTLEGHTYDDGDFYVDGTYLKSREALKKWSRYSWTKEPNQEEDGSGHIVKLFSYDTLSQTELCEKALAELKKACEMEVNYEVDITKLPENIKIGDRINIIDDVGELYVSSRVLKLEVSVSNNEHKATLGEYLIKNSGINEKIIALADQFAAEAAANKKALETAQAAKKAATETDSKVKTLDSGVTEAALKMLTLELKTDKAAKTATDFIGYAEDEGVLVGYKEAETGNWGGYRAHIKQESFAVVDKDGNEVAEYGANKIDLGKNNQDTEISFCGGKSTLKYDADIDYSRMSADALVFDGKEAVSLQTKSISPGNSGLNKEYSNNITAAKNHARMMASGYDVDETGMSVGDTYNSWVTVDITKATVGSDTAVHLQAPEIIADGDFAVSGSMFDNFGTLIGNGLAAYTGGGDSGIDPNTTLEGLCLTSHSNAPKGLGTFFYIHTTFYNTKSASAARTQIGVPYNKQGSIYHRYFASGAWSSWARYMTADEIYPVGSVCIRYDTTSPATLYGGTWQRIEGRMLFGCDSSGTVGATGTHTTGSGGSSLPYVNVAVWRRTA